MMIRKIVMLMAILPGLASYAQSTKAYTAQECVAYALENNVQIKGAKFDEQIAQAKVKEILGLGLPQVNGSFDIKDYLKIPTSLIPARAFDPKAPADLYYPVQFGVKYNATASLDASQVLFDGGFFVGLQASKTFVELSSKAIQRSQIEIKVAVLKAYYNVLVMELRQELLNVNYSRIEKLFTDVKVMYSSGVVEKLDLDRATYSLNSLKVEQQRVAKMVEVSYFLLKYQMGMPQDTKLELSDKISPQLLGTALNSTQFDYENRVEYRLLKVQERLTYLDLKRNRAAFLPSLVAYGNYSYQAQRNQLNLGASDQRWFPIALVGARLNIPILSSGQRYFKTQEAKISLYKVQNDIALRKQSIDLEVTNSTLLYQNNLASAEMQRKNYQLAEEIYNTTKIKYDQGVGSNLEVISAEAAMKEAQTNYYSAIYDALISKIDYEKATGQLN